MTKTRSAEKDATLRLSDAPDLLTPEQVLAILQLRSKRPSAAIRTLERQGLVVTRLNGRLRVLKTDLQAHLGRLRIRAGDE
jgi:hypothetical protein